VYSAEHAKTNGSRVVLHGVTLGWERASSTVTIAAIDKVELVREGALSFDRAEILFPFALTIDGGTVAKTQRNIQIKFKVNKNDISLTIGLAPFPVSPRGYRKLPIVTIQTDNLAAVVLDTFVSKGLSVSEKVSEVISRAACSSKKTPCAVLFKDENTVLFNGTRISGHFSGIYQMIQAMLESAGIGAQK